MIDWLSKRARATAGIKRGGFTATLVKPGAQSGGPWNNPTIGAPTLHSITVIQDFKQVMDASGSLVDKTIHRLIVSADGESPAQGDHVALVPPPATGAKRLRVAAARAVAPGGVTLMWEVDLED